MPLSWNEIKNRAIAFSVEWQTDHSENQEAKTFWDSFFQVFGISRRRVATFEEPIKKLDQKQGFIDLLWKGMILVEHKSKGKSLDKAFQQAKDYFPGLKEHELPKYILVSDFQRFRLYDLDRDQVSEFELKELVNYVHLFDFIAGYEKRVYKDEDPVNIEAALLMGELHDLLESVGYKGHDLEVYLVRLLFCLFADDTGIFEERGIFQDYIDRHTKSDGSDLAMHLERIFYILNQPQEKRLSNLDESLKQFPYINGHLFEESLQPAAFDSQMREKLLKACSFNWSQISPAIFGSMFQAVMNKNERRNLGAHYTSEKNIQKVIKPLFLDELYQQFEQIKGSKSKLQQFHDQIASLRFLDPACGCGNFLIITYRELRELEIKVLRELYKNEAFVDIRLFIKVDVDQFFGIEYDEFAVKIAEVAMWLIDHQMNLKVSHEFGQFFVRLPLSKSAKIIQGNALQIDWKTVIDPPQPPLKRGESQPSQPSLKRGEIVDYIFGNPPFVGKKFQNEEQKADMITVFDQVKNAGILDYVSPWYLKAAQLIQNTSIRCAFVSTNSISQGEQVGILWNELYSNYKIKIQFAHRTFKWTNEAKGKAAVHCVIIGFGLEDIENKRLFDYLDIQGEPTGRKVKNINPYLVEGSDIVVLKRSKPISNVPEIIYGSFALDNGYFTLSETEKETLITSNPESAKYIRKFIGGRELIHQENRFCIWLLEAKPDEMRKFPLILERIEKVKQWRAKSQRKTTQKLALTPTLFAEIRQPNTPYLAFPTLSSENRNYIPIAFLTPDIIASNQLYLLPNANLYLLGMLTSKMHIIWVKYIGGRFKSDYRYSSTIVYNNYPFPENVSEKQKQKVEEAAQLVLDIRAQYPNSSLADLYDPLTMPPDLVKAHKTLDKAVDLCYRPQPFVSELNRIEFLFNLYETLSTPLLKPQKKGKSKKNFNF